MLAGHLAQQKLLEESSTLLSAKRSARERKGTHAWHPYYAGYSENFVESAANFLQCGPKSIVLDPWGGSGTTAIVCARLNIPTISLDINPVMAIYTAAKSPEIISYAEVVTAFFRNLELHDNKFTPAELGGLLNIFQPHSANIVRHIQNSIESMSLPNKSAINLLSQKALKKSARVRDPVQSFLMAVVFKTIREVCGIERSANPTWLKKPNLKQIQFIEFKAQLRANAERMLDDVRQFYGIYETSEISSLNANAKSMPIKSGSIDAVITSPPYLTRIDYAMSTSIEMMSLSNADELMRLRHSTMGAPVITKNERYQRKSWGETCNAALHAIRSHNTKAAATYYWKNIVQYFMDAEDALIELQRILRPGGRGIIVVQSSYFKDVELQLGQIYQEMATALGMKADIVFTETVANHMAHVNTRSNTYKADKVFFEQFVAITKN